MHMSPSPSIMKHWLGRKWRCILENFKNSRTLIARRKIAARNASAFSGQKMALVNSAALFIFAIGFAGLFLDAHSAAFAHAVPAGSTAIFAIITDFGKSGWIIGLCLVFCLFLLCLPIRRSRSRLQAILSGLMIRVGYILVAVIASGLITLFLKWLIGRARPKHFDTLGALALDPFALDNNFHSFPSGHATTIFALAFCLAIIWPSGRWLIGVFALWVGISRIVVGAHFPSDVAAGACVGIFTSWIIALKLANARIGFVFADQGRIQPKGRIFSRANLRYLGHILSGRFSGFRRAGRDGR